MGLDESGKGDYFGPLVVAAVALRTPAEQERVVGWGVADSKQLSDNRCRELARRVRAELPFELVVIGPERYNELYRSLRNVNRILAWAHARALENLLQRVEAAVVVADQFAVSPERLGRALFERGRRVHLVQRHGAEADPAVAAASVVARAAFLEALASLGQQVGVVLPKGAYEVEAAAAEVARRGGVAALRRVAKLHFKTTARVGIVPDACDGPPGARAGSPDAREGPPDA